MISYEEGRAFSEMTPEELEALILKEFEALTPEELEALRVVVDEVGAGRDDLLQMIYDAEYKQQPVDIETFVRDEYFLGTTCSSLYECHLQDLQELFSGGYREAVWTGSVGGGKCLVKSRSYITDLNTGLRSVIEVLVGASPLVPSLSGPRVRAAKAARVWASGKKQCSRLVVGSGQWLEASDDHPVLTSTGLYERLGCLRPGNFVACARTVPEPLSPLQISEAEVVALACLIADGNLTHHRVIYTKGDAGLVSAFKDAVAAVPGFEGFGAETFKRNAWYVTCLGLGEWARRWGIDCLSRVKRVPGKLFGLPRDLLGLFLRYLWTDGSVLPKARRIEISLASEGLIDDIQELLRRFGLVARKCFSPKTAEKGGKLHDAWTLRIHDAPSLRLFLEHVGDVPGKEAACANLRERLVGLEGNPNWDVVPISIPELKEIRKEIGSVPNHIWGPMTGLSRGSFMGRERFRRLCAHFNYQGKYRWLADADLVWERVVSVTDIGVQDVYDLSVPETGNVVCNGIVVHNTFCASVAACRILYEISCLRDPHRSFGIAPGSNISLVALSVNELLAMHVAFENIAAKIKASPYFQAHFPFKPTRKELRFPNGVWVAARATTDTSALGLNVIGSFLDEINDLRKLKHRVSTIVPVLDQAESLYTKLLRRMKSRFEKRGRMPGLMLLVSSAKSSEDFTARRVKAAQTDPTVFVRSYCLSGNTRVPLLDGTSPTIAELATRFGASGESFEVYSFDLLSGRVVPGTALHPRITGRREEVLEVILDNGESILATPAHPFLLKSGEYRRADALAPGDSLMPLYRRLDERGYEELGQPWWGGRWQKTHHMAARARYGIWPKRGEDRLPTVVHHANFLKRDNRTSNLEVMEWTAHRELHAAVPVALQRYLFSEENSQRASARMRALHRDSEFAAARDARGRDHFRKLWDDPAFRAAASAAAGQRIAEFHRTEAGREAQRQRALVRWSRDRKIGKDVLSLIQERAAEGVTLAALSREIGCCGASIVGALKRAGLPSYTELKLAAGYTTPRNHQVVAVRGGGVADVYDLSVPGLENFAVGAGVFVHNSLWQTKPEDYVGSKYFHVLVGRGNVSSKILEPAEVPRYQDAKAVGDAVLISVPEDFRPDFESNLEDSIRDIGGVCTDAVSLYFQRRDKLVWNTEREHPYSVEVWDPSTPGTFLWDQLVGTRVEVNEEGYEVEAQRPLVHPDAVRYIHIDPAYRHDAVGIAMGCVPSWVEVVRRTEDGSITKELAPLCYVDFVLRIVPPPGDEIILAELRTLVYTLAGHGFVIGGVTCDTWNSVEMIQMLKAKGFSAEHQSVDVTMAPYNTLKGALYEGRVDVYGYAPLFEELKYLIRDDKRQKVDHLPEKGKSKDVADAVAGLIYKLHRVRSGVYAPLQGESIVVPATKHGVWSSADPERRFVPQDTKPTPPGPGPGTLRRPTLLPFLGGGFGDGD